MELWQAIVLGIVEGITEFLPVSSTGHLVLAQRAMGLQGEAANAYAICIQSGAIAAVAVLYRERLGTVVQGALGRDEAGRRLLIHLGLAFLPAAVFGVLLDDLIEAVLFGLWPIVAAWLVGGGLLLGFASRLRPGGGGAGLDALTPRLAVAIGLIQCLAMWPGTSRSLATILGAVLLGLSLPAAVEFSFLLGLITLGAATAYAGLKHGDEMLGAFGPVPLVVGFAASAVSGGLAIQGMVGWLQQRGMEVFAAWRIGLALVVAALLGAGVLTP